MKGWRWTGRITAMLAIGAAAAAVTGPAEAGQSNTATPRTVPDVDSFTLPPLNPVPRATPSAGPSTIPAPTLRPAPTFIRVAPTPTPRPVARTTPVPRPTPAKPVTPEPRRPVPTAVPTPTASPSVAPSPTYAAGPEPVPSATPAPATPSAVPDTASPPPAATESGGAPAWLAPAIGSIVLIALAFLLFRGTGRRRPSAEDAGEPAVSPPPSPPPPPVPTVPPADPDPAPHPAMRERHDDGPPIEITMIPRRAGTNMTGAAIDYQIVLRNVGDTAAREVTVAIYMLSASARQAADLQSLFASPAAAPIIAPFVLAPGAEVQLAGMALLDRERVNVMVIDGKPWFVPVLAIKADYRWGESVGAPGIASAAYMIGIDRGEGAKMAPFRLDTGPLMHATVSGRRVA